MPKKTKPSYAMKKAASKIIRGLGDADWIVAPISLDPPLNGIPRCPLVKAGDGGMWVPVYIYVSKK